MRKLNFLILGFMFCILNFTLTGFAEDRIVAVVNNDVITQSDLNGFINFMRLQLAQELKGRELENKIQSMKLDLLDRLIEDRLILQEAKRNNFRIDPSRVKSRVEEIKRRYPSEAEFQKALSRQGMVQADLEKKLEEQMLMYNIIEVKVRSKIIVNPSEVTDFYEKNRAEFNLPEERKLKYFAVENQDLAREISAMLKNGRDLTEISRQYNLPVDDFSAKNDGQLKKDVEEALFKLKPGEVSEPLTIEEVFYVFKLEDTTAARQESLAEAKDKIYTFLFNKKMEEQMNGWLDGLKKAAYIKVF